jgi:SAM-dependent methyltransferase
LKETDREFGGLEVKTLARRGVQALDSLRSRLLSNQTFTSRILPAIPRPIRWTLRWLFFFPSTLADRLFAPSGRLVPPKTSMFVGSVEGFEKSGERLVGRLVEFGGLTPSSDILDVGSGIGRLAIPLTRYLDASGSYEGLDIVEAGIRWCTERITPAHRNFHFTVADIFNKEYNPGGRMKASEYRFPYEDGTFDIAVLISVFTHLVPADTERYVAEISRILRPGGRCFATYLLVNEESRRLMESGASSVRFNHQLGPAWVVSAKVPELAVGYEEPHVHELHARHGLSLEGVHYAGWCGRPPFWSHESGLGDQDLVVAVKR